MTNVIDFEDDRPARLIQATDEMARTALLPQSRRNDDRLRTLAVQVLSTLESTDR